MNVNRRYVEAQRELDGSEASAANESIRAIRTISDYYCWSGSILVNSVFFSTCGCSDFREARTSILRF
jgi:hypothetical protein